MIRYLVLAAFAGTALVSCGEETQETATALQTATESTTVTEVNNSLGTASPEVDDAPNELAQVDTDQTTVATEAPETDNEDKAVETSAKKADPTTTEPVEVTVSPVASCTVAVGEVDLDSVIVSWPAATGAEAYVVSRSVNGEEANWRGKVTELSFPDTLRSGSIDYFVVAKVGEKASTATACSPTVQGADN